MDILNPTPRPVMHQRIFADHFEEQNQTGGDATWTDWDLSSIIGTRAVWCLIGWEVTANQDFGVRTNGSSDTPLIDGVNDKHIQWVKSDDNGIIEIYSETNNTGSFTLLDYMTGID